MNNPATQTIDNASHEVTRTKGSHSIQILLLVLIFVIFVVGFGFLYKLFYTNEEGTPVNSAESIPTVTITESDKDATVDSFTVRGESWVPFSYTLTKDPSYDTYRAYKISGFIPSEREVAITENSIRFDVKIDNENVAFFIGQEMNNYKYASYFPTEDVTEIDTLHFGILKRIENPYSTIFTDSFLTDECRTYSPANDPVIEAPCGSGLIDSNYVRDAEQELTSGYHLGCASTNPSMEEGLDPPGGYTEISRSACDYFVKNANIEYID